MRYVPDLIPEKSKVLPDYFRGDVYEVANKNPWTTTLMWIMGICFFLFALLWMLHPLLFFLYGSIGMILIPPGHRLIERKLRFRITPKIKIIACIALFLPSLPLAHHYAGIDHQIANQQKIDNEKQVKEKAIADRKEQERKDSLTYHIWQSNQLADQHKIDEAEKQLQYALVFVGTSADSVIINEGRKNIRFIKISDLIKAGKYKTALPEINDLLQSEPSNAGLMYNRALCYSKAGKITEAVSDLKPLIRSGNTAAEALYDKINPIKKRIVGYETLCCDGSTSYARGRGACSHHGGVCDWNHPIYEEYRKYE